MFEDAKNTDVLLRSSDNRNFVVILLNETQSPARPEKDKKVINGRKLYIDSTFFSLWKRIIVMVTVAQ